jgi:hypothetical protein
MDEAESGSKAILGGAPELVLVSGGGRVGSAAWVGAGAGMDGSVRDDGWPSNLISATLEGTAERLADDGGLAGDRKAEGVLGGLSTAGKSNPSLWAAGSADDTGRRDPDKGIIGRGGPRRDVLVRLRSPKEGSLSGDAGSSDDPSPRNEVGSGGRGSAVGGGAIRLAIRDGVDEGVVTDGQSASMSAPEDEEAVNEAAWGFTGTRGGEGDLSGLDTKSSKSSKPIVSLAWPLCWAAPVGSPPSDDAMTREVPEELDVGLGCSDVLEIPVRSPPIDDMDAAEMLGIDWNCVKEPIPLWSGVMEKSAKADCSECAEAGAWKSSKSSKSFVKEGRTDDLGVGWDAEASLLALSGGWAENEVVLDNSDEFAVTVGDKGEFIDEGDGSMGTAMALVGCLAAVAPRNAKDTRCGGNLMGGVDLGGGGRAGGSGPAKIGSLLIMASRPLVCASAPLMLVRLIVWSSAALGTSFKKSKSPAESDTDLRPEGVLENRFRKRETADGEGFSASGKRSSGVKKSGPFDGVIIVMSGVTTLTSAIEVSLTGARSTLVRADELGRGLEAWGEAARAGPLAFGTSWFDADAAVTSCGMDDARRFQKDRKPPVFIFAWSFAASGPSSFLSTIRQPIGTVSSVTSRLVLRDASQLDEPLDDMRKCASGLFWFMVRLRVSFSADDISFAVCVRAKCKGGCIGGIFGAIRENKSTLTTESIVIKLPLDTSPYNDGISSSDFGAPSRCEFSLDSPDGHMILHVSSHVCMRAARTSGGFEWQSHALR